MEKKFSVPKMDSWGIVFPVVEVAGEEVYGEKVGRDDQEKDLELCSCWSLGWERFLEMVVLHGRHMVAQRGFGGKVGKLSSSGSSMEMGFEGFNGESWQ